MEEQLHKKWLFVHLTIDKKELDGVSGFRKVTLPAATLLTAYLGHLRNSNDTHYNGASVNIALGVYYISLTVASNTLAIKVNCRYGKKK